MNKPTFLEENKYWLNNKNILLETLAFHLIK